MHLDVEVVRTLVSLLIDEYLGKWEMILMFDHNDSGLPAFEPGQKVELSSGMDDI